MSNEPTIILRYHRVAEDAVDLNPIHVAPDRFAAQMRLLRELADVVPLADVLKGGSGPRAAVTFDDGYADNLDAKLILEDLGVPATVFVTSDSLGDAAFWWDRLGRLMEGELPLQHLRVQIGATDCIMDLRGTLNLQRSYSFLIQRLQGQTKAEVDEVLSRIAVALEVDAAQTTCPRPLTVGELGDLAAGGTVSIGSHTASHISLPKLDAAHQREELERSRADLEGLLGSPVTTFAYPFGDVDRSSAHLAAHLYDLAVTTAAGQTDGSERQLLPRYGVGDWSLDEFRHRVVEWLAL
jgi:peptidoglycan/xylan/chitin deacetylase (PgdA/CDA1 family)